MKLYGWSKINGNDWPGFRPPACTNTFTRSYGLPCVHIVQDLLDRNQSLQLSHFHSHWHLQRGDLPQLLLEPRQRIDPVSNDSIVPRSSTRRELSGFELVQETVRAQPRCSRCHEIGHRMNSNSCPQRFNLLLAQPSQPSQPAQPANSLRPIQPIQPVHTLHQSEPIQLVDPEQPAHPSQSPLSTSSSLSSPLSLPFTRVSGD